VAQRNERERVNDAQENKSGARKTNTSPTLIAIKIRHHGYVLLPVDYGINDGMFRDRR
jgi:hypothetical protein